MERIYRVNLKGYTNSSNGKTHWKQQSFVETKCKRKIARAGRRGGKTTGIAGLAVEAFLSGRRVLYATPTTTQFVTFWYEVCTALAELIDAGVVVKNKSEYYIEFPGTRQRIKAKTAWNADTLRGDFADLLILDEWQLMDESAWEEVGAPMLMDNNGDAVFIYTPPSVSTKSVSKAKDKRHATKMFQAAKREEELAEQEGRPSRWRTFHWTSHDNPFISEDGIREVTSDMTSASIRKEIYAEEDDETPGALWTARMIDDYRVERQPAFAQVVIAVDPPKNDPRINDVAAECGIIAFGIERRVPELRRETHGYVIGDWSRKDSPRGWARTVIRAFDYHLAGYIVAEGNNGGEMVRATIHAENPNVPVKLVNASKGKVVRAEPVVAKYERGLIHHVGTYKELEYQLKNWIPGDTSPDRLDALVWAATELMIGTQVGVGLLASELENSRR